jgi:NADH:ubiquinone oxidoreductase subunit D
VINNVGLALAVEKLLGVKVPPRGQYIRTLGCEISRIADHLTCLAAVGLELGAMTIMLYCMKAREYMYELLEMTCGARVTTNFTRVGGQMKDLPDKFADECPPRFKEVRKVVDEINKLLTKNRIFYDRLYKIGVMPPEEALNRSWTGPCLRASGIPYDVRRDKPYLVYDEIDFLIPVGTNGDCLDRYLVRLEEIEQSLRICEQVLRKIPSGAINVGDPRIVLPPKDEVYSTIEGLINHFKLIMPGHGIRPPKGEVYQAVEAGNGELGFYVVSDGGDKPYRVRCRPPCLPLTASMEYMLKDGFIADMIPIFDSINMIGGELDR